MPDDRATLPELPRVAGYLRYTRRMPVPLSARAHRDIGLLLFLLSALVLTACVSRSGAVARQPGGTATASPTTAAAVLSTVPTSTPIPPTLSPTATATATPTAIASPTPSPSPSPLPTPVPTETPPPPSTWPYPRLIGWSAGGLTIEGFTFGNGAHHLVVVGGIHGGYEWNTVLLAYELIDHVTGHPDLIPANVTLTIIPAANPDGVNLVTGTHGRFALDDVAAVTEPGRFNASGVDINRNWDCDWQPTSVWRGQPVSAGEAPFSEAESFYLREFLLQEAPRAVIFLHSAVPGIFVGRCDGAVLPATWELAALYADSSGYPLATGGFTAYPVTGDASDYLARIGIPSFTVELNNHLEVDFGQNLAGVLAVVGYFGD